MVWMAQVVPGQAQVQLSWQLSRSFSMMSSGRATSASFQWLRTVFIIKIGSKSLWYLRPSFFSCPTSLLSKVLAHSRKTFGITNNALPKNNLEPTLYCDNPLGNSIRRQHSKLPVPNLAAYNNVALSWLK